MNVLNEVGLYYETHVFSLVTILKIVELPPIIREKKEEKCEEARGLVWRGGLMGSFDDNW